MAKHISPVYIIQSDNTFPLFMYRGVNIQAFVHRHNDGLMNFVSKLIPNILPYIPGILHSNSIPKVTFFMYFDDYTHNYKHIMPESGYNIERLMFIVCYDKSSNSSYIYKRGDYNLSMIVGNYILSTHEIYSRLNDLFVVHEDNDDPMIIFEHHIFDNFLPLGILYNAIHKTLGNNIDSSKCIADMFKMDSTERYLKIKIKTYNQTSKYLSLNASSINCKFIFNM